MSETKNEVAIATSNGFNPGVILSEQEIASAKVWLTSVLGQKSGISSIQDGMALIMRAKDLNIPLSTAVEHVHLIQGKTGVDIHILKALVLRAGTKWTCTKDYVPQYEYTDGANVFSENVLPDYCIKCKNPEDAEKSTDVQKGTVGVYPLRYYSDAKGNIFNEFEVSDKWTICTNKFHVAKINSSGGYGVTRCPAKPIDYIVEYEFTRVQMVYGEKIITNCKSSFSYSEAVNAGMFEKETYKKYPKIMIKARAWTYGARDIASDICMGLMETTELKQINNIEIESDDYVEVDS